MRKCGIFGINDEASHVQSNISIDEEDSSGKGANSVISMLNFYLDKYPTDNVVLFADNCAGQNKNNAMMQYLLWRVITGKNKKFSLNFMLTGHTKFAPDRNFGILKAKYAKATVNCYQDVIDVINASSPSGLNVAIPSVDPRTKNRNIVWYRWDVYLKQFFKNIPGITKYHHFTFFENGNIIAKKLSDSEDEVIQKEIQIEVEKGETLETIIPGGLSNERAWYLFQQVRPLCTDDSKADFLAPKPSKAMKKKRKKNESDDFE